MNVVFPKVEINLTPNESKVLDFIRSNPGRNVAIIISDTRLSTTEAVEAIRELYCKALIFSDKSYSKFYPRRDDHREPE